MTKAKLLETLEFYELSLSLAEHPPEPMSTTDRPRGKEQALRHCHWMIGQMREFIQQGDLEKTFRWLGFMQGVFFMAGVFSVEEMRDHNRG